MIEMISTDKAPTAIGPYSQAVRANNLIFVSGQLPLVPETMNFIDGDIRVQTRQCLRNLTAILEAAGCTVDNIARITVFLKDMNNFDAMNETYAECFSTYKPARVVVEVARLPKDADIEIEAVAVRT